MQISYKLSALLAFFCITFLHAAHANTNLPWPAEPINEAVNLTYVAPGQDGFGRDLSGAYWNEAKQELWLVRNGGPSKIWVLEEYIQENGAIGWRVKTKNGLRGEWSTGSLDVEGITFANEHAEIVYLIIEGHEQIRAYDVSVYGQATLRRIYNTTAHFPAYNGSFGAEAIAFVPNERLEAIGFTADNASGQPALRLGTRGMGGLMFVGHQQGGHLYVFDLDPNSNNFDYVGKYETSYPETAGLEFDRSTGKMYIWHDHTYDKLEVSDLRSTRLGNRYYRLNTTHIFDWHNSVNHNIEGIAVRPARTCGADGRKFFLTIDDGGDNSLFMFQQFTDGCGPIACNAHAHCPGGQICHPDSRICYTCPMDINSMGMINAADRDLFMTCHGSCYQPGHPCRMKNFDGSRDGCVMDSDLTILNNAMGWAYTSAAACAAAKRALETQYEMPSIGSTPLTGSTVSGTGTGGFRRP